MRYVVTFLFLTLMWCFASCTPNPETVCEKAVDLHLKCSISKIEKKLQGDELDTAKNEMTSKKSQYYDECVGELKGNDDYISALNACVKIDDDCGAYMKCALEVRKQYKK